MVLVVNKKATFEYEILSVYHAGLVLTGPEVKSIRKKSGSLTGSFVKIVGEEAYLLNAQISPYPYAMNQNYDPKRTRKLLLKRREINQLLEASTQKGNTLVPLALEVLGRNIKLRFGIGRGKKQFEKRAVMKERAIKRDIDQEMKEKFRS